SLVLAAATSTTTDIKDIYSEKYILLFVKMSNLRWIGESAIRGSLTWQVLVPAMRRALIAFSQGPDHDQGAVQPLRTAVPVHQQGGTLMVMPGYVPGEGALATKLVSMFPRNAAKGLSTHSAIVMLLNPDTGIPEALLEGGSITELRTAAASAVATLELMNDKSQAKGPVIAVLGAGVQGQAHARVLNHLLKPSKVRIWSRTMSSCTAVCEILRGEGIPAEVAATVQDAVVDADIINTCTLAQQPILKMKWLKASVHINSVGAPRPDMQELEEELVRSAVIYADSREAAYKEAGDIIKSGAEVFAEIGELLTGKCEAHKDKITIFKSLGLAVEDAVAAKIVYNSLEGNSKTAT
ncbi:unnamed protein product, partial [Meganyctiphanes norvegica]